MLEGPGAADDADANDIDAADVTANDVTAKEVDTDDVDAHLQSLRALNAVSKRVHASLDLTETLDAVADGVVDLAGFGLAVVNLAEPNGDFTVVSAAGSDKLRREMVGTRGSAANWHELFRRAERWGALYFVDHRSGVPETLYTWIPDIDVPTDPQGWHPLDCLFAPLMAPSGEWVGVLSVDLPVGGMRPGPLQREVLALFAEHAAIAILHARMHSALEQSQASLAYAATHDPLTGLANRAYLRTRVDELATRPTDQIGVLVVDLDGFKRVNDLAGHEAGDEVLQAVAQRMRRHMREGDVLARMGGDEFVAVLVGDHIADILQDTAERLRTVIAEPVVGRTGVRRVTASVGCAVGLVTDDFSRLVAAADAEMYREKHREARLALQRHLA
jgi:diguanylate cyclase (GGDEF)-like protein